MDDFFISFQGSKSHYQIATDHQKNLMQLILAPNLVIPALLTKVYQSEEVIACLVRIFYMEGDHIRLLNHLVYRELVSVASKEEATLFRGDSSATKAVRAYFKLCGIEYLKKTLKSLFDEVTATPDIVYELDPLKLENAEVRTKNIDYIQILAEKILTKDYYFNK